MSRINDALRWLASELSADARDFRQHFGKGADDLRDGLVAQGWAKADRRKERWAVSDAGFRKLEAMGGVDG